MPPGVTRCAADAATDWAAVMLAERAARAEAGALHLQPDAPALISQRVRKAGKGCANHNMVGAVVH